MLADITARSFQLPLDAIQQPRPRTYTARIWLSPYRLCLNFFDTRGRVFGRRWRAATSPTRHLDAFARWTTELPPLAPLAHTLPYLWTGQRAQNNHGYRMHALKSSDIVVTHTPTVSTDGPLSLLWYTWTSDASVIRPCLGTCVHG